jgi:type II secretory pathway component GspD/PulD (secretin)
MKLKLCMLTIVGLVAWGFVARAQNNPPAGELQTTTASITTTNDAGQPQAAAAEAAAPATNAPTADATAPATNAPAADAAAQPAAAADTNAQPAAVADASAQPADAAAASTTVVDTNAPAVGGTIPLIVMDDVPLTDAIKNLARQAGINYMLDPKVSFGQIGPDGRPVPQPTVSIRWENVTAQQALTALLNNYNLQMVEDPKSKIARVTVKDPAAPDPLVTKVIQLKYAAPTNIMVAVQNTLTDKRSKVVGDTRTSQLVVLATEKELIDVDMLVEKLDTKTKQVLIEARLLETSMNPSTTKGIDWSGTLAGQNVSFGNGNMVGQSTTTMPGTSTATTPGGRSIPPPSSSTSTVLNSIIGRGGLGVTTANGFNPGTFFLTADGVSAVLSFLNKYAEAKVLSTPRTVTLDNEPAKIEVTRASPIINITPGTVQVSGGSQILYTNLGVILNVTPRISANNYVNLKVVPEVSRVFDTIRRQVSTGNGSGFYEADEYDIRRIETRVMVPSGNTLVLGGLVQDDVRSGNTKVPILGDIPVVGYLFRSDTKSRQKSNLLVFITPTIVQDDDFQPTSTDFLKRPVYTGESIDEEWSSWDSGKPRDWSDVTEEEYRNAKYDDSVFKPKAQPSTSTPANP